MASWWKQAGRQVAVLALGSVLVASCTPHPGNDAAQAPPRDSGSGRTALGSFLAGRLAQAQGDTRAAAEYYAAALKHDPENTELLQRSFTLLVAEGRLNEAWPLADRLLAFDSDAPIPLLVAGLREAREGRFAQAESRFSSLPKRGVFGFLAPMLGAWAKAGAGQTDQAIEALAPLTAIQGLGPMRAFH